MEDKLPRRIAWFAPWTWKRRRLWAALLTSIFVVAYPLSIGPVALLLRNDWLSVGAFRIIYFPILMLARANRNFSDCLAEYMNLFETATNF